MKSSHGASFLSRAVLDAGHRQPRMTMDLAPSSTQPCAATVGRLSAARSVSLGPRKGVEHVSGSLPDTRNRTEKSDSSSRVCRQAGPLPCPPEAGAGILGHLKVPDPPPQSHSEGGDINILDPCAGEARAVVQIAEGLGVSPGHVLVVELNARRAAAPTTGSVNMAVALALRASVGSTDASRK